MYLLVTDRDKKAEDFRSLTFDDFIAEANSDDGIDPGDGLYIDISCVPSEEYYDALVESISGNGVNIDWISFDDSDIPEWFSGNISQLPDELNEHHLNDEDAGELASAISLLDDTGVEDDSSDGQKIGRIITFGSAKGGSGKTFTSLITAKYYAQDHPNERVCILDLDIEEPQLGIVIKTLRPTVKGFYADYSVGNTSFEYLKKCKANNSNFPQNLDFYLTPRESHPIRDERFWQCVMTDLFFNYDMVILDTGTTYMETDAIASAYKIADKICIVTMANLASTVTVAQQIRRLTGEDENNVYSAEDELENKLNLIVTNSSDSRVCKSIVAKLDEECPIVATFGNLTDKINDMQVLSRWNLFDDNVAFREGMKKIYS